MLLTADTSGVHLFENQYPQGMKILISGNYGSGTVKVQYWSAEEATWKDFPGAEYTTGDIAKVIDWTGKLRVTLSGSTSPSLSVDVVQNF